MGVGQGEEEHKTSTNSRKFWISLGHLFSLSIHPPPTHAHTSLPPSPLLRGPTHVLRDSVAGSARCSGTAPRSALDSAQPGQCSAQRVKPATRPANHQQSRSGAPTLRLPLLQRLRAPGVGTKGN